jgi:hypothetical protein
MKYETVLLIIYEHTKFKRDNEFKEKGFKIQSPYKFYWNVYWQEYLQNM